MTRNNTFSFTVLTGFYKVLTHIFHWPEQFTIYKLILEIDNKVFLPYVLQKKKKKTMSKMLLEHVGIAYSLTLAHRHVILTCFTRFWKQLLQ
jgi:hypothetical protein